MKDSLNSDKWIIKMDIRFFPGECVCEFFAELLVDRLRAEQSHELSYSLWGMFLVDE
jgi:hypothetical protein